MTGDVSLQRRVERLERENRHGKRLAILALLLALAALGGAARADRVPAVPEAIEARRFVLRDEAGRARGVLGFKGDTATLLLKDADGTVTAELGSERSYPLGR